MIQVNVQARDAEAQATEPITSGSVGLPVSFRFSEDWEGMGKTAIFKGSGTFVDLALTGNCCTVPHEVLASAGGHLKIGVYGTRNQGQQVTPTVWADAGLIREGAAPSEIEPTPATESLVQQILEAAEAAESIAQSVRDDADAGEFDGADGQPGQTGPAGPGVPAGGSKGQVLKKKSAADYDTEWSDLGDCADVIITSASGSPASISDGADDKPVADLTVQIGPSLTGYTGAKIVRTGKNLCVVNDANIAKPSWYSGGWSGVSTSGENGITQTRSYLDGGTGGVYIPELPAGTYVVSMEEGSIDDCCMGLYYTTDGTDMAELLASSTALTRSGGKLYKSFTLPANKGFVIRPTGRSVVPKSFNHIQIEQGSTPTDYETPVWTEYAFDWQSAAGTVYDGELDVTTGVLTEGADTYQLTPTEVKTLLGDNVIWADAGDVTVRYRADTKLYVDTHGGGGGSSVEPYTSNPAALGTASPGSSSKYSRGDHVHAKPTASDVGAIAAPASANVGDFLVYTANGWAATTVPSAQGVNF